MWRLLLCSIGWTKRHPSTESTYQVYIAISGKTGTYIICILRFLSLQSVLQTDGGGSFFKYGGGQANLTLHFMKK